MSDPFEEALSEAASARAEQDRRISEAEAAHKQAEADKRAERQTAFDALSSRIAEKHEALESFGFSRSDSVDHLRGFYRVTLSFEKKRIAAELARMGSGYHMFVWWDHVRSDDGFLEPIESADPKTLDEVMTTLGAWVGHHGKSKEV